MKRSAGVLAAVLFSSACGAAIAFGCGGDSGSGGAATGDDGGGDVANDAVLSTDSPSADTNGPPSTVTFRYKPGWAGATKVEVIGGFGQANDWSATQPFATLADDGAGTFVGTAQLPAGQYLYVFRVVGDAASPSAAFTHYAVDPLEPGFAPCPAQSPTYSKAAPNPCSQITVPEGAAAPTLHVRGVVNVDGAHAAGYLVEIERQEAKSHHFFANRVTTAADGAFDLVATTGKWRLQILHPTMLSKDDATRDPIALQALRRAISSPFALASDVTVETPDLAFHDYAAFAPVDAGGVLPTPFSFGGAGKDERLAVYGGTKEIGDPFYAGPITTTGTQVFDGGWNTAQAPDGGVAVGTRYFWGTELPALREAGVSWTNQTMVFPISWQ